MPFTVQGNNQLLWVIFLLLWTVMHSDRNKVEHVRSRPLNYRHNLLLFEMCLMYCSCVMHPKSAGVCHLACLRTRLKWMS